MPCLQRGRHVRPRRLLHQGGRVFVAEHDPAIRMRFEGPDAQAQTLLMSRGDARLPSGTRVAAGDAPR